MTNDTFTELSDDQLRQAIRDIAAWAEPSVMSEPSERPPVALVPLDRVGRRRWSQPAVRVAAAAAAVAIVVAAAMFAVDRSDPPVADEPSLQGVIDRLPEGLTTLDVVDVEALRAVESPTDKVSASLERAPAWMGLDVESEVVPDVHLDSVTVFAHSSNAPRNLATPTVTENVSIMATSEDPGALGAALLDAGFEEIGDGHYQRDPSSDVPFGQRSMAARVEPGYLTVVSTKPGGPTGLDLLPTPAGPSAGLASVLDAGSGFYLFSANVDGSVPGLGCGAAEAVVYGPQGYQALVLLGDDGTVRDDVPPEVVGFGATRQQRQDGDMTIIEIEPGPVGIASNFPLGRFTGDWGSFIDC